MVFLTVLVGGNESGVETVCLQHHHQVQLEPAREREINNIGLSSLESYTCGSRQLWWLLSQSE